MNDFEKTLFIWLIGFIVGYLIKKPKFTINLNFEKDTLKGVPKMQNKPEPPKK